MKLDLLSSLQNGGSDFVDPIHVSTKPAILIGTGFGFSGREALAQTKEWLQRPNSKMSVNRVACFWEADRILLGFIALLAQELQNRRRPNFLALLNYTRPNDCEGLMTPMRQASHLFSSVSEDEYYLNRICVHSYTRGQGMGGRLAGAHFDEGRAKGFSRF